MSMKIYTGVVEDRDDPLKIGRCRVRVVGLHTEDKARLPTEDLPWAHPIAPITSASMNGIGWTPVGPVNGTWVAIIFSDDDCQQPMMLGTLPGIPQSKAGAIAVEESDEDVVVTDGGVLTTSSGEPVLTSDGTPVTVGTKESRSSSPPNTPAATKQEPITSQPEPNKPADATLKQDIKIDPPPNSTSNPTAAKANIQHIINACDKVGLTSKYAKAAILGICGGESSWLCVEEGSYYTKAESLSAIFKRTFPTPESAQPYVKWNGPKADFFKKIYSPEGNGKLLGHKDPMDGYKYYGRGFNQITGRSLYQQLENYLKSKGIVVDFMNNPQSLIDDPATAALATAAFYALNVKHDQNDPGYFVTALKRTGADANGTGYAKKQKYYEYFLGQAISVNSTNKPSADDQKTYTADEVKDLPPSKQAALLEDRSGNLTTGFTDPKGKYPLRNLLDEPDTNRLARGVLKETAIEFKDSTRTKNVEAANGEDNWEQPLAPFGGMYPYAKVLESESGHLFVLDDTPTNEMVSLYHKTGSFIDIDANGTQVNKIVGDGYTIVDRNGFIFITGKASITVGNGVNILVQGSADIQVNGESNINLKNNANLGVGGDLNVAVGGDMNLQVGGKFKTKAAGISTYSSDYIAVESAADTSFKSAATISSQAEGNISNKSAGNILSEAAGTNNLKAAGNINVDGAEFRGMEGSAESGVDVEAVTPISLTPPDFSEGKGNQFGNLSTPVRPSPPIQLKQEIADENAAIQADYEAHPEKYYNADAAAGGVKGNYAGTPKDDGQGKSLISGAASSDIAQFLQKQLQLAESGYWRESGQGGKPSNANITRIWADLGFPKSGMWLSDQTAWCMGFVNWTLKQCGYRYRQSAGARAIATETSQWGATKITDFRQAEPGDIALWSYGHVNFVYQNKGGKLTFVGGNQTPAAKTNNPSDGDVSLSWPGGYTPPGNGSLVGIFRPSKA